MVLAQRDFEWRNSWSNIRQVRTWDPAFAAEVSQVDPLPHQRIAVYDLVIFDEAHKLLAGRGNGLRLTKTDRYRPTSSKPGIEAALPRIVPISWTSSERRSATWAFATANQRHAAAIPPMPQSDRPAERPAHRSGARRH